MIGASLKDVGERAGRCSTLIVAACFLWFVSDVWPAGAQTAPTAEEARLLEFGKEIFKSKAVCQYCHKWDARSEEHTSELQSRQYLVCRLLLAKKEREQMSRR